MKQKVLYLLVPICLFGCSGERDNAAPLEESVTSAAEPAVVDTASMTGEEAYAIACARCHDTGLDGAPVTGKTADWENRSHLWQAVLMEHAKEGFFNMPAKGGNPDLPEMTVSAAAEYMLEVTFPNLPRD